MTVPRPDAAHYASRSASNELLGSTIRSPIDDLAVCVRCFLHDAESHKRVESIRNNARGDVWR